MLKKIAYKEGERKEEDVFRYASLRHIHRGLFSESEFFQGYHIKTPEQVYYAYYNTYLFKNQAYLFLLFRSR